MLPVSNGPQSDPRILLRRFLLAVRLVALVPLTATTVAAQPDDGRTRHPGEALQVFLLTTEPGDEIWEIFGHNALLVRDTVQGTQAAYNYGLFDFAAPGFIPRFLQGEMMYQVAPVRLDRMMESYAAANRKMWAQELALDSEDKLELANLLATASLPENRSYRYEYFLNNCSTKLRDALDTVLDGGLQEQAARMTGGRSWRFHTRRLSAPSLIGLPGIGLLLGPKGDEPTSAWEEMWVPSQLRETVARASIPGPGGQPTPLVIREELWVDSTRPPPPVEPPPFQLAFLLVGLLTGGLIALLGKDRRDEGRVPATALALVVALWSALAGVVGSILFLVHWTDHEFMYWNQNILLFSPLFLLLLVLGPRSVYRGGVGPWTRRTAGAIALLTGAAAGLHLVPGLGQENGEWLALTIPVNLAIYWVFGRMLPNPATNR